MVLFTVHEKKGKAKVHMLQIQLRTNERNITSKEELMKQTKEVKSQEKMTQTEGVTTQEKMTQTNITFLDFDSAATGILPTELMDYENILMPDFMNNMDDQVDNSQIKNENTVDMLDMLKEEHDNDIVKEDGFIEDLESWLAENYLVN